MQARKQANLIHFDRHQAIHEALYEAIGVKYTLSPLPRLVCHNADGQQRLTEMNKGSALGRSKGGGAACQYPGRSGHNGGRTDA